MGIIKTFLRYVTDIIGPDLLSLLKLGGGGGLILKN